VGTSATRKKPLGQAIERGGRLVATYIRGGGGGVKMVTVAGNKGRGRRGYAGKSEARGPCRLLKGYPKEEGPTRLTTIKQGVIGVQLERGRLWRRRRDLNGEEKPVNDGVILWCYNTVSCSGKETKRNVVLEEGAKESNRGTRREHKTGKTR